MKKHFVHFGRFARMSIFQEDYYRTTDYPKRHALDIANSFAKHPMNIDIQAEAPTILKSPREKFVYEKFPHIFYYNNYKIDNTLCNKVSSLLLYSIILLEY